MFRGSGYAWNKNFVWTGGYEVAVAKPTVAASAGSATDAAIVVAKHGGKPPRGLPHLGVMCQKP